MPTIDRNFCRTLNAEIERDLQALAAKHGLKIVMGGGKFSHNEYEAKVIFNTVAPDGSIFNRAEDDFKRMAHMYGLQPTDLGRHFTSHSGQRYKIVGLKPQNTKFPIIGTDIRGKSFKFPAYQVKRALAS